MGLFMKKKKAMHNKIHTQKSKIRTDINQRSAHVLCKSSDGEEIQLCSKGQQRGGDMTQLELRI